MRARQLLHRPVQHQAGGAQAVAEGVPCGKVRQRSAASMSGPLEWPTAGLCSSRYWTHTVHAKKTVLSPCIFAQRAFSLPCCCSCTCHQPPLRCPKCHQLAPALPQPLPEQPTTKYATSLTCKTAQVRRPGARAAVEPAAVAITECEGSGGGGIATADVVPALMRGGKRDASRGRAAVMAGARQLGGGNCNGLVQLRHGESASIRVLCRGQADGS